MTFFFLILYQNISYVYSFELPHSGRHLLNDPFIWSNMNIILVMTSIFIILFLLAQEHLCCRCLLELPHWGISKKYWQHIFPLKKIRKIQQYFKSITKTKRYLERTYEPQWKKTSVPTMCSQRNSDQPAHSRRSESSLGTFSIAKNAKFLHEDSKDTSDCTYVQADLTLSVTHFRRYVFSSAAHIKILF